MNRHIQFSLLLSWLLGLFFSDPGALSAQNTQAYDAEAVDNITLELARFVIDTEASAIPASAYEAAEMAVLDLLGCAMAGYDSRGAAEVAELILEWGGREESTIWFHNAKVPAPAAAYVDSVQAHALDYDDYHPPSDTHITVVLVPTVFAVGEANNATGREVFAALALGSEVVGRLGRAYKARRDHPGFLPTSVIGGFGAVAAACRLQGCTVEQTADAMGIYYAQAAGNRQALFDRTLTKRLQPANAARAGVFSSYLARKGINGPRRIIGGEVASLIPIYGAEGARDNPPTVAEVMAPRDTWAIEELNYKRFACCGVSGPPLQAMIGLANEHDLQVEAIEKIRIFGWVVRSPFGNVAWETTTTPQVQAQFCVPYAVASSIRNRQFGPHESSLRRIFDDVEVDALARRTYLCEWDEWEGQRPSPSSIIVEVTLKNGQTLTATQSGHDRWTVPDDNEAIQMKFRTNAIFSGLLDEAQAGQMIAEVGQLNSERPISDFIATWLTQ